MSRFFCLTGLACQSFFNGFKDFRQVCLILLARRQFLIAGLYVVIELGQDLLALLADFLELVTLGVEAALLHQQLRLLHGDVFLDIGQLAQGFVEILQLLQASLAQVVVIGEGTGESFRILLVEQQLEVFLATVLIGRPGLNGNQSLLFNARALEFFFLRIESLQLGFAFLQLFLQGIDLLLELAHFGFGALELFLHTGLFFLQLAQQLLQLGNVLTRGVQLLLGICALVSKGRLEQACQS
ncbi:hypothetical protein D3C71_1326060 [compost metagenome]